MSLNLGEVYRAVPNADALKAAAVGAGGIELAPLLNIIDGVRTAVLAAYGTTAEDAVQAVYAGVADLVRGGSAFSYPVAGPGERESNPMGNIRAYIDWLNDLVNYAPAATDATEAIAQAKQDQYQLMLDLYATLAGRFTV